MAKRQRVWTRAKFEKHLNEGRGQGEKEQYIPWITIHDFSSRGIVTRIFGYKTRRVHHFLSRNELLYFYILEWSDDVLDIREQYPLIDVEQAAVVAAEAGIRYPSDNISGFPYVLTCDFLITTRDGLKARTIKESSALQNKRTLEKLEIERRYWNILGIDWAIITEQGISEQKARTIEWVRTGAILPDELSSGRLQNVMLALLDEMPAHKAVQCFDETEAVSAGSGLQLFKHLVWTKQVVYSLNMDLKSSIHLGYGTETEANKC